MAVGADSDDDPVFEKRRRQIQELDHHLRELYKHIEDIAKAKRDLHTATKAFWLAVSSASSAPDLPERTFTSLANVGSVQVKVRRRGVRSGPLAWQRRPRSRWHARPRARAAATGGGRPAEAGGALPVAAGGDLG